MALTVTRRIDYDFGEMHRRMQWWVDEGLLPCVATVVLHGDEVVDVALFGYMDLRTKDPLRLDAIHRMYSNTKLVTSVAAMTLYERGLLDLDDPVEKYIPAFSGMRVLREGATSIDETVAAERSVTLRHLLSHTSGLSYGFDEPGSVIDRGYADAGLAYHDEPLEDLCRRLAELPLAFQPGTAWRYSFATDVVAHLLEVVSGMSFDMVLEESIFSPLDMVDTGFYVPEENHDRLVTMYSGTDRRDHTTPAVVLADEPGSGASSRPRGVGPL